MITNLVSFQIFFCPCKAVITFFIFNNKNEKTRSQVRSIFVKHAEWGRIASSQVDYEGRLFGVEVFMRLVIRELKIIFCCMLFFPVFITIAF